MNTTDTCPTETEAAEVSAPARVAYVKSGDVVASLERLSNTAADDVDDGGPDAFLDDLLRARAGDQFLLIGVALVVTKNRINANRSGIRAISLAAKKRFGVWRNSVETFIELLRFKPSWIVCGKCGGPLWASYLASRLLGVSLFHSRHNWLEQKSIAGRFVTRIDNWIVRRIEAVVCHGPYLRDRLASIGVPRERTFEFDSGNSTFVHRVREIENPSVQAGGVEPKLVTFAGRVVRQKGVFDLLDACIRIFPNEPAMRLVYAGFGKDLEVLQSAAEASGFADRVDFLGSVSHVEGRISHLALGGRMRASRVVVAPTRNRFPEGRCMVVMEALAVGTPVIAPRFGPFPYLVRHEENGLLFEPNSVDDLERCVRRAVSDERLYQQIAKGAASSGAALLQPDVTYSQAIGRALALVQS